MYWMRRVRKELMAYQSLQLRRKELLEQLNTMDESINPRISKLTGMPRVKGGLPKSSVEFMATRREEELQVMKRELAAVERLLDPIQRGLDALSTVEREVIKRTYFDFNIPEDEIAASLGLSDREYEDIKYNALCTIDVYTMEPGRTP